MRRLTPGGRLAVAGGVVAALFSLLYQAPGVVLSPDGWAYWEGSVSILRGDGYRYLDGPPIHAWPPGFSAYLALWQLVLGVSTGTLAVAHAAAIGVAAACWIAVAMRAFPRRGLPPAALAAAATLALLLPIALRAVLSESLFMAWMGAALLVAVGPDREASAGGDGRRWAAFGLLAAAMLLTRHVGVAYLPALAWIAWRSGAAASRAARTGVALAVGGGLVVWLAARLSFGLVRNNPRLPFDAEFGVRFASNLLENLAALAASLLPRSAAGLAGAALLVVAASLGLASLPERVRRLHDAGAARGIRGLLSAAALAFGCAAVVWALHGVHGGRIVLPVAALAVLALVHASVAAPRVAVRRAAVVALLVLAAVQLGRAAYWARHASTTQDAALSWSLELVAPCAPGADCPRSPDQIEPPSFGWIVRERPAAPTPDA